VLADVEAEYLQFGGHAFGEIEVAELARGDQIRHVIDHLGGGEQIQGGGRSLARRRGLPGQHAHPGEQVPPRRHGRACGQAGYGRARG
jgi:hypothetical protein